MRRASDLSSDVIPHCGVSPRLSASCDMADFSNVCTRDCIVHLDVCWPPLQFPLMLWARVLGSSSALRYRFVVGSGSLKIRRSTAFTSCMCLSAASLICPASWSRLVSRVVYNPSRCIEVLILGLVWFLHSCTLTRWASLRTKTNEKLHTKK